MDRLKLVEDEHSVDLFAKRGIQLVRGADVYVWDSDGKRYIDCTSGQGVAGIGHANPAVVDAISKQAKKLLTCTGSFYNDQRARLIEKLVEITPQGLEKVFLCNSGTESIEAALKFARLASGKTDFICAMKGFHGRTMGALSATYTPKYREDFQPLVPGFEYVPYNNIEKLIQKVTPKTAAVLLELVQGEGGVYPAEKEYITQIKDYCQENNILLIIDEVQTGFGRTGKLFACAHYDVQPDILCLAKALGGGFPIGAVLTNSKITLGLGKHGTTFGGNPLASAAAVAALDFIIENDLPENAAKMGKYFKEKFSQFEFKIVREVRQVGLMIGIELKVKSKPYINRLQDKGILALPAGTNILRLLPPLTIQKKHIDRVIAALAEVLYEDDD
jgi:LysW-gamma-L-lysine/LysW-L-ornithine aminotransferase